MWKCNKCKEYVADEANICPYCGIDRIENIALDKEERVKQKEFKTVITLNSTRSKYSALKTIAIVLKLFAWIYGFVTVIITIYFGMEGEAGFYIAIPVLVIGSLIVLLVLAISELIMVLIDIEYNTRQNHKLN